MARTAMLTEGIINKIVLEIGYGNYARDVCLANDISEPTFYNYMNRGKLLAEEREIKKRRLTKSEKMYLLFFKSVTKSRANARTDLVKYVHLQAITDGNLALKVLARIDPEHWAEKKVIATADLTPVLPADNSGARPVDYSRLSVETLERIEMELENEIYIEGSRNEIQQSITDGG